MTAYLNDADALDKFVSFERTALSSTDGHNERWLQESLFTSPKLLPMTEMFGHGEAFVPDAVSFHCVLERRASSWICWASRPRESWFSLNASSGVTRKPEMREAHSNRAL
jgi:hypothetical protein